MILFKACPRCRGDMQTQRDMYGSYAQCLQCGHIQERQADPARAAVPQKRAA